MDVRNAIHVDLRPNSYDLKNEYGYEVHVKWECEFREELKRDPELKAAYDELFIPSALDHRVHTLRGGRTEPFAFSHRCELDNEDIYFLDIVSLPIFYFSESCVKIKNCKKLQKNAF